MSEQIVRIGSVQSVIEQLTGSQLSTASYVLITGMTLDASALGQLAVTATTVTNAVDVGLYGANISDYSDEVLVTTLQPTASVPAGWAGAAGYLYYRLKIKDTVGGSHGTGSVVLIGKLHLSHLDVIKGTSEGFKLARGTVTPTSSAQTVATGLTQVVAALAGLHANPSAAHLALSCSIGDQAGAPAAGSIIIRSWKLSVSYGIVSPASATSGWVAVDWIAIGI